MNWFYESEGQQQGPVSERDLDRLLAEGKITPNTLVWQEGMPDWRPLRDARPSAAVPPPFSSGAPTGEGATPAPGYVRCSLTGKLIPESDAVYIQGRPYSAEAKAAVLQSIQQGEGLPTAGDAERTGPPWEHRAQLGFIAALWETIKGVLTKPAETFQNMKREGGLGTPLLYNVILGSVGGIAGAIYQTMITFATESAAQAQGGLPSGMGAAAGAGVGVATMCILMPALIAIGSFVTSGIMHVSLMICGGAKRDFETTFRTYCYSSGSAGILQVVPICGALVAGIWGLVALCIGLSKTHEISTGRAVCAVLLPTALCCAIMIALGVSLIGVLAAAGQGAGQSGLTP